MSPAPSSRPCLRLLIRGLLIGSAVVALHFLYLSASSLATSGGGGGAAYSIYSSSPSRSSRSSSSHARVESGAPPQWSSREWRHTVDRYAAVFRALAADGFLSPSPELRALCLDSAAGEDALALREIGVSTAVGVAHKQSRPLLVSGDLRIPRLPFAAAELDFIFAGRALDRSLRPAELADELDRILKPEGIVVALTASAGDSYSLHSLSNLFYAHSLVRSRNAVSVDLPSAVLHEIVFQKRAFRSNADSIPSSHANSVNACPILEHKLEIIRSAEPLIKEEPLKPWIALKRNLANIVYLPSLVDISFKRKYFYVDVGARSYGSSIGSWFRKKYPKQNHTFSIFAIEADSAFHAEYSTKKGVTLLPFAAWVRNESLTFEINGDPDQKEETKGRGMGRIQPLAGNSDNMSSGDVRQVPAFDFADWLKSTVSQRDYVVMKMDVEGTEFDLIPRLFENGAICLVDELFLECHYNRWQKCCPGERSPKYRNTYEECMALFSSLRESGVLVHQWW